MPCRRRRKVRTTKNRWAIALLKLCGTPLHGSLRKSLLQCLRLLPKDKSNSWGPASEEFITYSNDQQPVSCSYLIESSQCICVIIMLFDRAHSVAFQHVLFLFVWRCTLSFRILLCLFEKKFSLYTLVESVGKWWEWSWWSESAHHCTDRTWRR